MSEQNVMEAPSFDGGDFEGSDFAGDDFGPEPSNAAGGPPAPGQGQSKSSRRRRRKRKNKMAGDPAAASAAADGDVPALPIVMEGESLALAAAVAPAQQPRRQHAPAQGSQNNQGGFQNSGFQNGGFQSNNGFQNNNQQPGQGPGGKRWKKKFRDRDRDRRPGRNDNPGNDARADNGSSNGYSAPSNGYSGGGYQRSGGIPDNFGNLVAGFKRKGKGQQPRERGFVGPMDHSYREAEDAFATPSTINLSANGRRGSGHRHHGDSQPIDHNAPRPVPIPDTAQCHIYFFIEELFFVAKIQETAKKLGVKVAFVKNDKEALAELTDSETNRPALIVFDLNNANAKPLTLIPKLKTKLKKSASIVGFLSHLQGDLKAKAVEAGCDVVMPRSAFSQNLPNLLRRYGVEEEEEINYNY